MVWAANTLNTGYYSWRYGLNTSWVISDGSLVPVDPTVNPGTAGLQYLFAQLDDYPAWLQDVSPGGFYDTYYLLFGFPFAQAVEPLIPAPLEQPELWLPFNPGEVWAFTGGPHAAWDSGSPYGALDFAPPGEAQGCVQDDHWVTAVADGVVTRTGGGVVALDLDLDGWEQTGWVIIYMHIEQRDRVLPGTRLRAGDPLGHASCEGGISSGTHVHLARKFNGEWIPVNGLTPFTLSGWLAAGTGEEYVGSLSRGGQVVQSFEGNSFINQVSR
jgi:murein DD-endopeptidase MepM/ murein hydrolase activator NlpD